MNTDNKDTKFDCITDNLAAPNFNSARILDKAIGIGFATRKVRLMKNSISSYFSGSITSLNGRTVRHQKIIY